jgi:hypothetical protein
MFTRSNIIKRAFCHHRDLIPKRVSILSDKEKIEDLTNNINIINTKIDSIHKYMNNYIDNTDTDIDNIYKFLRINFVLVNCIFIPFYYSKVNLLFI